GFDPAGHRGSPVSPRSGGFSVRRLVRQTASRSSRGRGGQRPAPPVVERRGLVERGGAGQQVAAHVVLLVAQLAQDGGDDLPVGRPQRRVRRRAVVLDLL